MIKKVFIEKLIKMLFQKEHTIEHMKALFKDLLQV